MRKMMVFTMTSLIGLALLMITFFSTQATEQRQKQIFDGKSKEKVFLLGSKTKFSNSIEITQQDIQLMWQKVQLGMQLVDKFWQTKFYENGMYNSYRTPQVRYYTSPVNTNCGQAKMNNAFYCPNDHTIYFDAVFFTQIMKTIGNQNGSDGDMAVIFILAHEWGHAVQGLTGRLSQNSILNETNADCTAGAFTLFASQQGWLEQGDLEETVYTISVLGDDLPWTADGAHGDSEERLLMFKRGFQRGLYGCGGGFAR